MPPAPRRPRISKCAKRDPTCSSMRLPGQRRCAHGNSDRAVCVIETSPLPADTQPSNSAWAEHMTMKNDFLHRRLTRGLYVSLLAVAGIALVGLPVMTAAAAEPTKIG